MEEVGESEGANANFLERLVNLRIHVLTWKHLCKNILYDHTFGIKFILMLFSSFRNLKTGLRYLMIFIYFLNMLTATRRVILVRNKIVFNW